MVAPESRGDAMTTPSAEKFHLFLSYHNADKSAARAFATQCRDHDIRVWFDEWDMPLGIPFPEAIEQVLSTAPAVAVLVGPTGTGPWEQLEINVALIQAVKRGLRIIPILLPGVRTRPDLPL